MFAYLTVASLRDFGLALLSGILLVFSFPKFDLSVLAWVALVPLLVALEGKSLRKAFFLSHLTGLVFVAGLSNYGLAIPASYYIYFFLLAVFYLPLYVSFWSLALNWIRGRTGLPVTVLAPPLWVASEYVRSHFFFLAFPWALLGHTQYLHPSLIQITSVTGVYGLTFLIVLANAAVADTVSCLRMRWSGRTNPGVSLKSPVISLTLTASLLVAIHLYGSIVLSRGLEGETIKVALVQGNIAWKDTWDGAFRKKMLDRYAALTRDAAKDAPRLIVWPETAVPGDVKHDLALQRKVGQVAADMKSYLLVGSSEYAKFSNQNLRGKYYNTMVLLTPEGTVGGEYRKIALVPFAEYVPLRDYVRWPAAFASTMGDFLPGAQYTLFTVGGVTFGATLCWENIFPDLFREFVKRGARFMVNGTNDAWSGDSAEPYQHIAINTFRAAENRVAIARSTNAGISSFIDPFGRITHRLRRPDGKELFIEGVLIAEIPLSREQTFYTRYGDVFAHLQIAASALVLVGSWLTSKKRRQVARSD